MYHVVSGKVFSSTLKNELLAPSLLKVERKVANIRINIYGGSKVRGISKFSFNINQRKFTDDRLN